MTTSAPPPRDPESAADPITGQPAAGNWHGRVADHYAGQQAEADQDAELDARQIDAQHQQALAETQAQAATQRATKPEASL